MALTLLGNVVNTSTQTTENVGGATPTAYIGGPWEINGPLPAGAAIVVFITSSTGSVSSVTDKNGNTYIKQKSVKGFNGDNLDVWLCKSNNVSVDYPGSKFITVTFSGIAILSFATVNAVAYGLTGQDLTNTVDNVSGGTTGIGPNITDALAISDTGDIVLSAFHTNSTTSVSVPSYEKVTLQPNGSELPILSSFCTPNALTIPQDQLPIVINPNASQSGANPRWTILSIAIAPLGHGVATPKTGIPTGATNTGPQQPGTLPSVRAQQVFRGSATLYTPGGNPSVPNNSSKNTDQTGPATAGTCVSVAISNAKFIQKKVRAGINPSNASYVIGNQEPAAGYFSVLPLNGPDNINTIAPQSGAYGFSFFTTNVDGTVRNLSGLVIPSPSQTSSAIASGKGRPSSSPGVATNPLINEPLFNGTIHLLNITYSNKSSNFNVPSADLQTVLAFMQQSASNILAYCQQWGNCNITVDPTIHDVTLTLDGDSTKFNDETLSGNPGTTGFIDTIAAQLGYDSGGPTAHCFVVLCPTSVTNTDCAPPIMAYHNATAQKQIPYIYMPMTQTSLTSDDLADGYQIGISHEMAEMIVDPASDLANPEVCDLCSNCQPGGIIRNFFDSSNNYIQSSEFFIQGLGPGFTYAYMIDAISQPPYATTGSNTCPDAPYGACAYAPPGYSDPNYPNLIPGIFIGILQNIPIGPSIPIINILPESIPIVSVPIYTAEQLIGQAPIPSLPSSQANAGAAPSPPIILFPNGVNEAGDNIEVPATAVPPQVPVTVIKLPFKGY